MKKFGIGVLAIVCVLFLSGCDKETVNEYIVTFNSNGGSNVALLTVKEGELATRPSNPTREGYTFVDWYLDLNDSESYNFSKKVESNITLNAKWSQNDIPVQKEDDPKEDDEPKTVTYKITLDSNGGSKVSNITYEKGKTLSLPTPTRSGYKFLGWYNGKTKVTKASQITKDVKLTAKWEKVEEPKPVAKTFTVTFDSNGGTTVTSQTVKEGNKATKPANPTKEGYTFVEWQLSGKTYDFNNVLTSDVKLTAVWKKNVVYSYVLEDVSSSTTGEVILYLLKDNAKIAGSCVIEADTGKMITKEIPVTGYRTNKFKIINVTNITEK